MRDLAELGVAIGGLGSAAGGIFLAAVEAIEPSAAFATLATAGPAGALALLMWWRNREMAREHEAERKQDRSEFVTTLKDLTKEGQRTNETLAAIRTLLEQRAR